MKCAVVIPTLNAVRQGYWQQVLQSLASQTIPIDLKVIVDSASTDQTRAFACAYGWKCIGIHRNNFDHGLTRTRMLRYLLRCGFDTVVFLSQDVILVEPDTLEKLVRFLWGHDIVGCYGRQISSHKHSLNAWQRSYCYPDHSCVKSISSSAEDGLMTAFFPMPFPPGRLNLHWHTEALKRPALERIRFLLQGFYQLEERPVIVLRRLYGMSTPIIFQGFFCGDFRLVRFIAPIRNYWNTLALRSSEGKQCIPRFLC